MSQDPTRRDITTQGLLAALGLALGGGALAADPDTPADEGTAATPTLTATATLSYADADSPSCLTGVEDGDARLLLKIEVENVGSEPVEVLVTNRKVTCSVRAEALIPGQEEPWMLGKAHTECGRPQSRAIQREQLPLLPQSTLVMGTWELRWPGGLDKANAKVTLTSSITLATGVVSLPEQTVAVPAVPEG